MALAGSSSKALSIKPKSGAIGCFETLIASLVFSIFLVVGCVIIWIAAIGPLFQMVAARSWTAVPCTITSSEVVGNDTYLIDIHYDYEFEGQKFSGKRYSFFTKRTSGKASKEKVVQQYPPGARTSCYVDPRRPSESVIYRNAEWNLLWGLFGVPFLLIGLGGMYGFWTSKRKSSTSLTNTNSSFSASTDDDLPATAVSVSNSDFDDEDLQEEPGPVTLKPESTPLGAFLVMLVVGLVWNGIVLAFCSLRAQDWMQGKWQWLPELILVPFALVGFLLIFGIFHSLLGLFNPIPVLTLSRRMIPLGGTAILSWKYNGSSGSIRQVKVTLKGVEEARYTRGTDTHTDTSVFFEEILFETQEPTAIAEGQAEIRIPTDTMHSFSGSHNKIKWQLRLRGEIPRWPDVSSEFSIRVIPHE